MIGCIVIAMKSPADNVEVPEQPKDVVEEYKGTVTIISKPESLEV
jgi:hypothetical protein